MPEIKCECHDLKLPRWDIYICPYCKRQLAFLEVKHYKEKTFIEKIKDVFK